MLIIKYLQKKARRARKTLIGNNLRKLDLDHKTERKQKIWAILY